MQTCCCTANAKGASASTPEAAALKGELNTTPVCSKQHHLGNALGWRQQGSWCCFVQQLVSSVKTALILGIFYMFLKIPSLGQDSRSLIYPGIAILVFSVCHYVRVHLLKRLSHKQFNGVFVNYGLYRACFSPPPKN